MRQAAFESELCPSGMLAALAAHQGDYILKIREAAGIMSVSGRTVQRLVKAQKLRAVRLSDRRIGIWASEVSRYLSESPDTAAAA